jgi:hypothetical protein
MSLYTRTGSLGVSTAGTQTCTSRTVGQTSLTHRTGARRRGQGEAPSSMSGSTHVAQRHPPCPNPARLFDLTCRIRPLIASSSGLPGFSPLGRTNSCHKPRPLVTERARSARKAIHDTYRCTSCVRRGRGEAGTLEIQTAQLEAERASDLRWTSGRAMYRRRLCGDSQAGLDTWRALLVGTDRQMLYRRQR